MNPAFLHIHVGKIEIESDFDETLLSLDERQKAERFSRDVLKKKYQFCRYQLRTILADYLSVAAKEIDIRFNSFGKPYIDSSTLYFNLSHTADYFALAVSNQSELGIDIEQQGKTLNMEMIARRCFSRYEFDYWMALADNQKPRLFYQLWVRKEAFVKAVGQGIALGMARCVVNCDKLDSLLLIPDEYGLAQHWMLYAPELCDQLTGCVAINNRCLQPQLFTLTDS